MNGAAFPSPTAEMAEMNRIQYELEYTEGISQRMRIPEMLKVAPQVHEDPNVGSQEVPRSVIMQVPERIVIAGWYTVKQCSRQSLLLHTNSAHHWCLSVDCSLAFIWLCYSHWQLLDIPLSVVQDFVHLAPRDPFTDQH